MDPSSAARRPQCARCLRPASSCLCPWAVPVAHQAEVLVLQHPLEVAHAKGTARLLHLCLPRSRIEVGERFGPALLQDWLAAPTASGLPAHAVLLYPDTPQNPALPLQAPPPLPGPWLATPAALRLVVLDGTWRKSRKMLYLNPLLQQLPRLPLEDRPTSRYGRLRRAKAAHQLSTLEAACAALAQIDGDAARYAPVLAALDGWMAQATGWQQDGQPDTVNPAPPAASPAGC